MTVYVDSMKARLGRMIMCHMLADTDDELHTMAEQLGIKRKWHQKPGTPHSHYDICKAKRAKALELGAVEVNNRQLVSLIKKKRLQAEIGGDNER